MFQEFGDSARARRLYADDDDDEEEQELEPNPKLSQGELSGVLSVVSERQPNDVCWHAGRQCFNERFIPYLFAKAAAENIPLIKPLSIRLVGPGL